MLLLILHIIDSWHEKSLLWWERIRSENAYDFRWGISNRSTPLREAEILFITKCPFAKGDKKYIHSMSQFSIRHQLLLESTEQISTSHLFTVYLTFSPQSTHTTFRLFFLNLGLFVLFLRNTQFHCNRYKLFSTQGDLLGNKLTFYRYLFLLFLNKHWG